MMRGIRTLILTALAWGLATSAPAADTLDWNAWRRLPVFDRGRLMPLDTFARESVGTLSNSYHPKLTLPGQPPRTFDAAELLYRWIVEPEKWEDVSFLHAEHHELRQALLKLPIRDEQGNTLKYVSPRQVRDALASPTPYWETLRRVMNEQQRAAAEHRDYVPTGADRKAKELYDAYALYRLLSFDPLAVSAEQGNRFRSTIGNSLDGWRSLGETLQPLAQMQPEGKLAEAVTAAAAAAAELDQVLHHARYELADVEPPLVRYRDATATIAAELNATTQKMFHEPGDDEGTRTRRATWNRLLSAARQTAQAADEAQLALYDSGQALRLIPALRAAPLERGRNDGELQPWLDLRAMLVGSDSLLAGYPRPELQQVRAAWRLAQRAFAADASDPQRAPRFALTMHGFAQAVRTLGEKTSRLRTELPLVDPDQAAIRATAYPPPESTAAEVRYNQFQPFLWSWIINLAALVFLALAFGVLRRPLLWLGAAVLLAGQAFTAYGLGLRAYITGWVPIGGMFETIVFVSMVASVMGLWLTVAPLFAPGLQAAWRRTGIPGTWETRGDAEAAWGVARGAGLTLRACLAAGMLVFLLGTHYGESGRAYFSLWPRTALGSSIPTLSNLMVWAVSVCVLATAVWILPRAVLSAAIGLRTVPQTLAESGLAQPLAEVQQRKTFALAGAMMGFLAAFVAAYWMPLDMQAIGSMTAVLRDNFWLTIHVLTITSSYAAGTLAVGLGNLALGYYLFGRYRATETGRVPPDACAALGGYIYTAVKVAVLLLAAGTIFGGLWADVSWGRFWGWDAKEVGALLTLLVYLAFLHGRYVGWINDFGMAVGSVVGATFIISAWYGVNFVFPSGMHAYATGEGGQWQMLVGLALDWAFVILAAMRYVVETRPAPVAANDHPESIATRSPREPSAV